MSLYTKVRFFKNDSRLANIDLDNLIKINSEEEFGDNYIKLNDAPLSETEKELLRKLLIKKQAPRFRDFIFGFLNQ